MDVSWQDSVASFLDSSGTDPGSSFSGDGATLWSAPADSGLFSGQSMLWESGTDSLGDSFIGRLSSDSASPDTGTLLAGGSIDTGTSGVASGSSTLDGGLLWAGAGETSSPLVSGSGAGGLGSLGALDVGVGNGVSQWQQFVADFAGPTTTFLSDPQHLLWTSGTGQPPLMPPVAPVSLHLADSLTGTTVAALAPEHLVWTDPSAATGLTAGPSLRDAAPPTVMSGVGAGVVSQTLGLVPLSGAGAQF